MTLYHLNFLFHKLFFKKAQVDVCKRYARYNGDEILSFNEVPLPLMFHTSFRLQRLSAYTCQYIYTHSWS